MNVILPVAKIAANRAVLERSVDDLVAGGGTAVFDATLRGVDLVASLRDTTRINAVVVLTDGEDNESAANTQQVVTELQRRSESDVGTIRVFTIAYGKNANTTDLSAIANASGGEEYAGDPGQIDGVYRQISSFF